MKEKNNEQVEIAKLTKEVKKLRSEVAKQNNGTDYSKYSNLKIKPIPKWLVITLFVSLFIVVIGVVVGMCVKSYQKKLVDGKYELIEVSGTASIYVSTSENYAVLDNGVMTLYTAFTNPYSDEIYTYSYKGKTYDNCDFESSRVNFVKEGIIQVIIVFDDGTYSALQYKKT